MFDHQGIVDQFIKAGNEIHVMNIFAEGKQIVRLTMDELDSPYPFVLGLPQCDTERLITGELSARGIVVERECELSGLKQDPHSVVATIKSKQGTEEEISVQYLVGCDGAHSATRHLLNLPFEGSKYNQLFWLADVAITGDFPEEEGSLYNTPQGLCAIFPFGNGRARVILEFELGSATAPSGDAAQDPTLDQVQSVVNERIQKAILLQDPHWLAAFSISRRSVRQYSVGRIFLAGDAAHIHSPAGGQGMNTGLQDAYNLGWKLELVLKGAAKPELLESYNTERHAVAQGVLKMTDFLTKVNTLRNPLAINIRDAVAPIMAAQEVVQQRLRNSMSELSIGYRHSPIVAESKIPISKTKALGHSHTEQPELGEWFEFSKGPLQAIVLLMRI